MRSTKTECDYVIGWITKRSHAQRIPPKMANPRYSWRTQRKKQKKKNKKKKKKKKSKKKNKKNKNKNKNRILRRKSRF